MISAILMMAGNATRMHSKENKVFLALGKKMVFEYALELFLSYDFEVICVIRKEDRCHLKQYEGRVKIVYGGTTRQESVYQGLKEATRDYVLIHDAARPFLAKDIVDCCIHALKQGKACLVVQPCKDSVYLKSPLQVISRDTLALAQTPQGGKTKEFLEIHHQAKQDGVAATDDISLFLQYKSSMVELIEGNDHNFKITTQLDYITAKELVKYV